MRIALAQLNLHVGAIEKNSEKIIQTALQARDQMQADVVLFPELSLTSYPPEDLLLRPHLYQLVDTALQRICAEVTGIDLLIGYPRQQGELLFNSCCLIRDQKIVANYDKQHLPNYSVFDEKRYFSAADQAGIVEIKGRKVALTICEDIWISGTGKQAKEAGADLIFNLNASPYHKHKRDERQQALQAAVAEAQMPIVYVNLIGGQDQLVFDGGSAVMDEKGNYAFIDRAYQEETFLLEISNTNQISHSYTEAVAQSNEEQIYKTLVLGVRDYVQKNGFKGAVLGMSGGIDSALTAAIAVDALGKENVQGVLMPSRYTAEMSNEDAILEADALGIEHTIIPIKKTFDAFLDSLAESFAGTQRDTTEENLQARCRGVLLMAISNKTGKLLLSTGNKSEMAVGYATLYGDMNGGFAPLKDISKQWVYRLSIWRNQISPVIPQRVIDRPPSAELAPDQQDSDSLPPYEILDAILEAYIERDESPDHIIKLGFDREIVERIVSLVDRNEYKRRQAAPGVRITKRAFGRDRRYPITSGYREF